MDAPALVACERPFEGCALLRLNRPAALNALSAAMRRQLAQVFAQLRDDAGVRVVVLTGEGRGFCAGMDLRELAAAPGAAQLAAAGEVDDPVRTITSFPKPVIAAINGPAVTGGLELALACDVLLASERATFADTHARVGVLPTWGLSQRLQRLIGTHRAREMALTGNFIGAAQAERWGLVNRVVPHDELLPQALQLARDMLSTAPGMLVAYKQVIAQGALLPLAPALELEARRSKEWSAALDRGALAAHGRAVRERGREQQPPGGAES